MKDGPIGHGVKERPEGSVAAAVVVILENRSRFDGNGDNAVRLESVRRPREASRSALGNLFHGGREVVQASPTNLQELPVESVSVGFL